MKRQDFYFDLPPSLIAQYPLKERSASRLLVYNRQKTQYIHSQFNQLIAWLNPGDVLVLNNTKVVPARFFGKKESGGNVEFLFERTLNDNQFLTHIKASKAPKPGSCIYISDKWQIRVIEKHHDLYVCTVNGQVYDMLYEMGHIPLPRYIDRIDNPEDQSRYQTVYALHKGSVAAPTAGLHFDEAVLTALKEKGIIIGYVTLHVGAGTFKPVRAEQLSEHVMHKEHCVIDEPLCHIINEARLKKNRVIAVGTTSLRTLETAAASGTIQPYAGETGIFIYPGYTFKVCDGLITNFHLPESTLLMLVSAFIGHQETMNLYQEAIRQQYRFFSYGDASFLF